MIFTHNTICLCAKAYHNIAEYTVVHIQTAFPEDLSGIDLKGIALLDMVV